MKNEKDTLYMAVKHEELQHVHVLPSLPYEEWKETLDTLHMWMQIVGKVKLALAPFMNQWWQVVFYVTVTGMTTGRIPYRDDVFQIDFDFISHQLVIYTSKGNKKTLLLQPRSVADFYIEFMDTLTALDIAVTIHPVPTEIPNPIPFQKDTKHVSYDPMSVTRWWYIQLYISSIFDRFRTPFRGKSSPIQFFWGGFDLSGTRFSGKTAQPPQLPGEMGKIMRFGENEENFAFGFWSGDERFPYPAFYTYIYPAPKGFETINTGTRSAYYNKKLSEYILPYEDVRKAENPEETILSFLQTTYTESATLAGWDIQSLEGPVPSHYLQSR